MSELPSPADPDSERGLAPSFTFAYQPIVDAVSGKPVAYEALIRGRNRESAFHVLQAVPREIRYQFDADARAVALRTAALLGLTTGLNLNCLPMSLVACPPDTLIEASSTCGLSMRRLILEVTEEEVIADSKRFESAIAAYREAGVRIALDDFGAGYAGLNLLADFQPDIVKIDMKLVRGVDRHGPRQAIVRAIVQVCGDLGIDVTAEGIETEDEYRWLRRAGISLFQGYLFAKPGFECLPAIEFSAW
jgi:blue light- and temperature-responsive anti-repressor